MTTKIGHAHVKVRDVDHAAAFYEKFLGLHIRERLGRFVFMAGGDMRHELALQGLGPEAGQPGRFDVGLFHVAFEVPDRATLAQCYRTLVDAGVPVFPVDHRIRLGQSVDDNDKIEGLLIRAVGDRPQGRTEEFLAWARTHEPKELDVLMPGGDIDPSGDHPQRFRRLLNEWRVSARLGPVEAEDEPGWLERAPVIRCGITG